MMKLSTNPLDRLIVGLDLPTADQALPVMDRLAGAGVNFVKIGPVLMLRMGLDSIKRELSERGIENWFLDGKFCNTDKILAATAREAARRSPTMMNCMADSGPEAIKLFADECRNANVLSLVVSYLTTKDDSMCRDQHPGRTTEDQVLFYAKNWIERGGADGMVCSALEVPALRESGYNGLLVTPGIVFEGDQKRDQRRTIAPAQAFKMGTDYAVMATGILQDPEPRVRRFEDEVGAVL